MSVIIIQIISVLINSYIAFAKNIKHIYIVTFLFNLSLMILYLVNQDKTTFIIYIIITIRSFIYIYKDKFKTNIIPWIAIIIQLILGILTMDNIWQVISILTPCYSCYYLWYSKNTQELRIGNIIANSLWLIYNLVVGLYIVMIMRFITVIMNIIAYNKHK